MRGKYVSFAHFSCAHAYTENTGDYRCFYGPAMHRLYSHIKATTYKASCNVIGRACCLDPVTHLRSKAPIVSSLSNSWPSLLVYFRTGR